MIHDVRLPDIAEGVAGGKIGRLATAARARGPGAESGGAFPL